MKYRAEIDGLRAVAVIPVILFHGGFEPFSGGYVGVDIFFVISGFLITTIILDEKNRGQFRLLDFYERRARRILPALFFVMLACLPLAWLWLMPQELEDFSASLTATSLFASNFLFWRTGGYFDTVAEFRPLIHTWSLSVEEQYYLLVPLFFIAFWRFGKRNIGRVLVAAFLVSLALAQWGATAAPYANFFLLPSRAWELLAGALVAFYFSGKRILAAGDLSVRHGANRGYLYELAAVAGMALIITAILFFDKRTPFPSLYTLVPVGGTVLIIIYAHERTLVGRFLGNRLFVGIGLISYSAYLWHQPLFAFARNKSLHDPSQILIAGLSLLSLALAYFSWRFVERPFRDRNRITGRQLLVVAISGTLVFSALGMVGKLSDGFSSRLPPNIKWQSLGAKLKAKGEICIPKPNKDYSGLVSCEFGAVNSSRSIMLFGDSHAMAISEQLHRALLANNIKGILARMDQCETVPQIYNTSDIPNLNRNCVASFASLLSLIKQTDADVVVASRWTFKLFPITGEIEDMPSVNSEGGQERSIIYREYAVVKDGELQYDAETKKRAVEFLVNGLLSTGQNVYFVYPIPEISWDIARLNVDYYQEYGVVLDQISIPYSDFEARNRFVNNILGNFEQRKNFIPIKPEAIFCNSFREDRCVAQFRSIPFYYDDDHLSNRGARLLVNKIMSKMENVVPAGQTSGPEAR